MCDIKQRINHQYQSIPESLNNVKKNTPSASNSIHYNWNKRQLLFEVTFISIAAQEPALYILKELC